MRSELEADDMDDMEIAPDLTVGNWKALDLDSGNPGAWSKAIEIFALRIQRRFIEPVDLLISHDTEGRTPGFVILAIDCLLVETFQGFREGCIKHHGKAKHGKRSRGEELFVTYLSGQMLDWFDEDKATKFYKHCRCAIHHSGQTDGDFRVWREGQLIEFKADNRITVNRTAFHDALKRNFESYLAELADGSNCDLRTNFKKKMDAICGIVDDSNKGKKS